MYKRESEINRQGQLELSRSKSNPRNSKQYAGAHIRRQINYGDLCLTINIPLVG